jgi:uncharacterized protein (UPF0332 family)
MKEVEALVNRAERYLKSAHLLLGDGDYESAVSRIYYAMFFAVQTALLTKNLSTSSHKGTISTFSTEFIKTGLFPREMGRELNRAFEKRQLGDYTHTFVITVTEAEQALHTGQEFLQNIIRYLTAQQWL